MSGSDLVIHSQSGQDAAPSAFTTVDTPVQSAIYTIQSMLHEHSHDKQMTDQLSQILRQLMANDPYMPTFNFSKTSDLAEETKSWITNTFGHQAVSTTPSSSAAADASAGIVQIDSNSSERVKRLQTLEFNCWDLDHSAVDALIFEMFDKFTLLQTFAVPKIKFQGFIDAVRRGYRDNPYHNFLHGFDVLQVVFALCSSGSVVRRLTQLEVFVMFIVALCIDIDHGKSVYPFNQPLVSS